MFSATHKKEKRMVLDYDIRENKRHLVAKALATFKTKKQAAEALGISARHLATLAPQVADLVKEYETALEEQLAENQQG